MNVFLKEKNQRKVLSLIRTEKVISAANISKVVGLQPSTVHYIIQFLTSEGFVKISKTGNSTVNGGKPPTLLQLNETYGYIIGVELICNINRLVCVDFSGNILYSEELQTELVGEEYINSFITFLNSFIFKNSIDKRKLIGVCIAVSGIVGREGKDVVYSRMLKLQQYPLAVKIENAINVNVYVGNDANIGAIGYAMSSQVFGKYENFNYLTFNHDSENYGLGIVLHGQLYTGTYGMAGEIIDSLPSILQLLGEGIARYGNNHRIVQQYASLDYITLKDVMKEYEYNCPVSAYIIEQYSEKLSYHLVRLMALLNPEVFVVGGDIAEIKLLFDRFIWPKYIAKCKSLFPDFVQIPSVEFANQGKLSVAYGATTYIFHQLFNEFI